MKCPKCGYLGFEAVDRCRNCGYDFSLAQGSLSTSSLDLPELPMREAPAEGNPLDDLALIDAASPVNTGGAAGTHATEFAPDIERLLTPRPRDSRDGETRTRCPTVPVWFRRRVRRGTRSADHQGAAAARAARRPAGDA